MIEETGSGVKARKRLDALLVKLTDGDELIVSEIDRLGRTTADVISMMGELTRRGVALKVMGMPSLDVTSDDSRLIADIVASLAAHERRHTRRRQVQGIAAAKKAKRHLGRPHKMNGQQIAEARARIEADEPARIVARAYGVDVKNAPGGTQAMREPSETKVQLPLFQKLAQGC